MPRRDARYPARDHPLYKGAENPLFLQSRSPAMRGVLESAKQAAASDATILLIGEGGTGKSLLAKQIHLWSPRRAKTFVSIDCIRLTQRSREGEKSGYALDEVHVGTKHAPGRLGATEWGTLFHSPSTSALRPRYFCRPSRQIRRSSFITACSFSAGPGDICTSGIRISALHLPMKASACLTGIGLVSTKIARTSGSSL